MHIYTYGYSHLLQITSLWTPYLVLNKVFLPLQLHNYNNAYWFWQHTLTRLNFDKPMNTPMLTVCQSYHWRAVCWVKFFSECTIPKLRVCLSTLNTYSQPHIEIVSGIKFFILWRKGDKIGKFSAASLLNVLSWANDRARLCALGDTNGDTREAASESDEWTSLWSSSKSK